MKTVAQLALLTSIAAGLFGATENSCDLPNGLYAIFSTSEGVITAKLYEKYTPKAVENFVGLAAGTKAWRDPRPA